MYALTNCDIYTGEQVIHDKCILIDDSNITDIVPEKRIPSDAKQIDLAGKSIAPGFIDLQVNGGGGKLFNDLPSEQSLAEIAKAHQRFGTTNFLPALITDSKEKIIKAIHTVNSLLNKNDTGILGIHLEGPFINAQKAGVHNKDFIKQLDKEDIALLTSLNKGITLITLAPELCESELIQELHNNGVLISAGHSNATLDDFNKSVNAGLSCVTHLFNAMSQFTSREPGLVGAALVDDNIYCGIIVDGFHIHFSSIRVAWNAKNKGKMFLVTDSMPPVGCPDCKFQIGPYSIHVENGKCVTEDGVLAGSALDMATAVRNCIQNVGIPKDEALRMASTYPAQYIKLNNRLGYIAPGYKANLVVFNNQIYVTSVIVNGKLIDFE